MGDVAEYAMSTVGAAGGPRPRLAAPIDVQDLVQTGRAKFEVSRSADEVDVGYFDDDDDEEEGRFDEDDDATEAMRRRGVVAKKDFAYLKDVEFFHFITPAEGVVVEDLFDGAIKKILIHEGQGPLVPDNCKVFVHYICATEGASVFDSTLTSERSRPAAIDLRQANVLPGIYLALKSMRVFEAAKFMIRYDKAYGELGCPPRIPPVTDIVCSIEVLSVVDEERLKMIKYMSPEERSLLPFPKIVEFSSQKKQEGNSLYKVGSFWRAKRAYFEAINVLEDYPVLATEANDERQELLFVLYNNLAQCFLKMEKWPQACVACKKGLVCSKEGDPTISKLLYRFAIAKRMLGQPTHALDLIKKALKRDPDNKSLKIEKNEILERIKEEKNVSNCLMSRMGGAMWGDKTKSRVMVPVANENVVDGNLSQREDFGAGNGVNSVSENGIKPGNGESAGVDTVLVAPSCCPIRSVNLEATDDTLISKAGLQSKQRKSSASIEERSSPALVESQEQQKKNWEEYRHRMMSDCETSVVKPGTPSPLEASVVDNMSALELDERERGSDEADGVPLTFEWEDYRDRMLSGEENQLEPEKLDKKEVASRHGHDLTFRLGGSASTGKMVMVDSVKSCMSTRHSLFDTANVTSNKVKRLKKKRTKNANGGEYDSEDD